MTVLTVLLVALKAVVSGGLSVVLLVRVRLKVSTVLMASRVAVGQPLVRNGTVTKVYQKIEHNTGVAQLTELYRAFLLTVGVLVRRLQPAIAELK